MSWENSIVHVALTDVGLRRANNQDAFAAHPASSPEYWQARGHFFMVADGMGAHAAGELASKLASETVPHTYSKLSDQAPPIALVRATKEANQQIHNRGRANAEFEGMGTTATSLVLLPEGAVVAHVGDSRAYRLRQGVLEQLSFDHSLVWELQVRGKLTEQQIAEQVPKNIITRSLGPSADVAVDLEGPFPIEVGDTFLLCSDGLSGQVDDDEIGAMLTTLEPAEAAQTLIDLANLRGGPDNITLIVVKVTDSLTHEEVARLPQPPSYGAQNHPLNPIGLAITGVLALLTVIAGIVGSYGVAAIGALCTAAAAAVVFRHKILGDEGGWTGGMLGRGPYRRWDVQVDEHLTQKLAALAQELRDAGTTEDWNIDWFEFNRHCERAAAAAEQHDYATGAREYCRAISFMMSEVRGGRKKKAT